MEIRRQQPGGAPPPGMRIRRATPEDAAGVAVTQVASWRIGYAALLPDTLLASLSVEERTTSWLGHLDGSARGHTFIATSDDDTVHGFTTVGPSRDDDASELRALGFSRATLWVLTGNERARRFYEGHGWRMEGQSRVDRRGDVRLEEVRYELADLTGLT